ncbi:hypothetical protein BaRGS_00035127 [Batillaria attramentaria]|uniref:Uncharacterized protein n=1 Tax=Batillaria attramentaria TaxID=370345 RepID=A0ABD0JF50_9CAEN
MPPEDFAASSDADKPSPGVTVLKPKPQQAVLTTSFSFSKLQRPRAFLADKLPVATWTPAQTCTRTSSSSSIDRESQAESPVQSAPLSKPVNLRGLERRDSNPGPPVMPRKVSLSDLQKSLQRTAAPYDQAEQPSLVKESDGGDVVGLRRQSLVRSRQTSALTDDGAEELPSQLQNTLTNGSETKSGKVSSSTDSSSSGAPKKRLAPRPRFNARRLTQDSNVPVVWQCSEDAKTEYKPRPLSTSFQNVQTGLTVSQTASSTGEPLRIDGTGVADDKYRSWAADFIKDRILLT